MARPTVARIDLDALAHNVRWVRRLVGGRRVCAVVKADAYGHGAPLASRAMDEAGADMFAVAMTEEGVQLREAGIRKPVLLLAAVPTEDIDTILEHDLSACVVEEAFARELSVRALKRGLQAPIHVKVDTGMRRVGVDWQEAAAVLDRISRLPGLRLEGTFSHFACADGDDLGSSYEQIDRFRSLLSRLRQAGTHVPFGHMANSAGVLRLPESYFDGVRPGLILYGLLPRLDLRPRTDLKPVLSLRTATAGLRRLPAGQRIGYGHTFTTRRESIIANLPIGYHDGYFRHFSNVAQVLVRGRRAPVVGRVSMDRTLVDVTDVPGVEVGDEVVVYGRQGAEAISVEEMAARVDRIPYELTCAVSTRVRRQYVMNGEVVAESSCFGISRCGPAAQHEGSGRP